MVQVIGEVKVGTGRGESSGDIDCTMFQNDSICLQTAMNMGKRVIILGGIYTLPTPVTIAGEDQTVEAYGATFLPTGTTASTGSAFIITGDGTRFLGGRIKTTVFTESQYALYLNDADTALVQDTIFESTVTPSSYTNPMHFLRSRASTAVRMVNVNFIPAKGIMCWSTDQSPNFVAIDPQIPKSWAETPVLCHQVFDFLDSTHPEIVGGRFYALGTQATRLAMVGRYHQDLVTDDHFEMRDTWMESIAAPIGIQISGGRHSSIMRCKFASFLETESTAGNGCISIQGTSGPTSGTAAIEAEIIDNIFHDVCQDQSVTTDVDPGAPVLPSYLTTAPAIYLGKVAGVTVQGNISKVAYSPFLSIDCTNTTGAVIANNTMKSTHNTLRWGSNQTAIRTQNAATVSTWMVHDNKVFGSGSDGYQSLWSAPTGCVDTGTEVIK